MLSSTKLLKVDLLRATDDQMITVAFFFVSFITQGSDLVAAALIHVFSHFLQQLDLQFDIFLRAVLGEFLK